MMLKKDVPPEIERCQITTKYIRFLEDRMRNLETCIEEFLASPHCWSMVEDPGKVSWCGCDVCLTARVLVDMQTDGGTP